MADALKDKINISLKDHFDRNLGNDYDSIVVLVVYWKESDQPGFKSEALELEGFFREQLQYPVIRYEIPSRNSFFALDSEITRFLTQLKAPHSLAIVHYGGHGDPDFLDSNHRRRRGVWAARNSDGPTVNWSDIQPKLAYANGDVLLLLDCCYAAQAARTADRVIPPNVELHAACAMGCQAAGPGPGSFTTTWIKEVQASLASDGHALIAEVHHKLAVADCRLVQTPVYFPLQGKRRTIRLEPLSPTSPDTKRLYSEEASLTLQMTVRSPLAGQFLDEIIYWLKTYAPREVSGLVVTDVVSRAEHLRDFVLESSPRARSLAQFGKMPEPSRNEIWSAWDVFNVRLGNALRFLVTFTSSRWSVPNSNIADEAKVDTFLRNFEDNISALQRTIERNVMALPELYEKDRLTQAIDDPEMDDLGIAESLRVRLMACFPAQTDSLLERASYTQEQSKDATLAIALFPEQHPTLGNVLVEYKNLENSNIRIDEIGKSRLRRLADVLQAPASDAFRTPRCLGWFSAEDQAKHGLIFRNSFGSEHLPVTLHTILSNHSSSSSSNRSRHRRPTLGQRFIIARKIGQALLKWHSVGWVHQGIASYNIVFFKHTSSDHIDYSEPYLCGFDYTRESNDSSAKKHEKDTVNDIYRHPDRQGCHPPKRHTKVHDIYSFGLLLLEIGLWDLLPSMFGGVAKRKGLAALRHEIVSKSRGLLSHEMGLAYEDATIACLVGDFGVTRDDRIESELARAFDHRVLRKLDAGLGVDGNLSFYGVGQVHERV